MFWVLKLSLAPRQVGWVQILVLSISVLFPNTVITAASSTFPKVTIVQGLMPSRGLYLKRDPTIIFGLDVMRKNSILFQVKLKSRNEVHMKR